MTGLVLVVDDNEKNLKLLEALLANEYYDVITAMDGYDGLNQAKSKLPDIILLDVMMPGMDGFETCKKLKADPATSHIPVVMVTALSDKSDRVKGLESGADDFLTKPIKELHMISRVRSLIRLKVLQDELRLRDKTGTQMGVDAPASSDISVEGSSILLIDDDAIQTKQIKEALGTKFRLAAVDEPDDMVKSAVEGNYDLIIISTQLVDADGLRICSQLRSNEATRSVPILALVEADDERSLIKGFELGVNDYVMTPLDQNELFARVRTQLRRKLYQDALKSNYKKSISMAITDGLTGLYNRHYLNTHIENMISDSLKSGSELAVMMMDMDHFKKVNDTYGHDCGDEVLKELAGRIVQNTRGSDLVARVGGEEFVIVMPKTGYPIAREVAERIRKSVESVPFRISHEAKQISKTISIGVAELLGATDSSASLMKRADEALYKAKNLGRNRVMLSGQDF